MTEIEAKVGEARQRDLGSFMLDALNSADDNLTAERLRAAYLCGMTDLMLRIKAGEEPCYQLLPLPRGELHAGSHAVDETAWRTVDELQRTTLGR